MLNDAVSLFTVPLNVCIYLENECPQHWAPLHKVFLWEDRMTRMILMQRKLSTGYIDVGDDQHKVVTNMTVTQKIVSSLTLWIKILVLFGGSIGFILQRNGEELKRTERQYQQYVYTCERPIVMCDPNPCDPNGWPPVCKWVLKPVPTHPTAFSPIIESEIWNSNPMPNLPYSNNGYNNGNGQGYGYGRK